MSEAVAAATGPDAGLPAERAASSLSPEAGSWMHARRLENVVAYIPPQCFTKTRPEAGRPARNPCYVCHTQSEPPNFASDEDLQLTLSLPVPAAQNPWTNLFDPPVVRAVRPDDDAILKYVRESNYVDADGGLTLARRLKSLPPDWDGDGDGAWGGFVPDVWFHFDAKGFDHRPDGTFSGWRAFAYYPFPGAFFPTNGSADDVLVRLDPVLQEDAQGHFDPRVYEINLAIVESLIARRSVPIDAVDEAELGNVDLDLDGRFGRATRVAYDGATAADGHTRMHYVGKAHELESAGTFPIAVGLFPRGTEFFHTVRYLDVGPDGVVTMAPRMKEVRYARKVDWFPYERLRTLARGDVLEQEQSTDGTREILWGRERGIYNGQGWTLQGFIEGADGALRPQSFDETAYCVGCHGGIGVTTDSIFTFARKIAGGVGPGDGWTHWSQRDLRGLPEPKRVDGTYEYTTYLQQAGAGDELRANTEVMTRFFDERQQLRSSAIADLHRDITTLLLPTPARALDLDRAYQAIVHEQSFGRGRDAVLAPASNVYARTPRGEATGIKRAVTASRVAR
jgi:hypothetical protein